MSPCDQLTGAAAAGNIDQWESYEDFFGYESDAELAPARAMQNQERPTSTGTRTPMSVHMPDQDSGVEEASLRRAHTTAAAETPIARVHPHHQEAVDHATMEPEAARDAANGQVSESPRRSPQSGDTSRQLRAQLRATFGRANCDIHQHHITDSASTVEHGWDDARSTSVGSDSERSTGSSRVGKGGADTDASAWHPHSPHWMPYQQPADHDGIALAN